MTVQVATEGTLAGELAVIEAAMDRIQLGDYDHQSPAETRAIAASWQRIMSRGAIHAGRASRAVRTEHPKRASQVISRSFGNNSAAVQRQIKDADTLAESSRTEQAAADGQLSHQHAKVISRAMQDLPADVTAEQRAFAERALIRDAGHLSPHDLATRARRITDQFKNDEQVDADEDRLLRRREALARAKTSLSLWDNHDGTWSGRFTVPELHGRILKTATDAHTAPRRNHLDPAVDPFEPLDKRQGKAFCHILEHIPVDKLPTTGGTPIRIVVTISEDKLRSNVAAATLATGERLSAGELRRLACNHHVLPMVLSGDSIPIDLGRAQRLFSKDQRDALAVMDGGCTAPGCDRPPSWCEVQHTNPWKLGGNTDLDNATLHCNACHHRADQEGWTYKRINGRMHIDRGKGRGWELNHRYRP